MVCIMFKAIEYELPVEKKLTKKVMKKWKENFQESKWNGEVYAAIKTIDHDTPITSLFDCCFLLVCSAYYSISSVFMTYTAVFIYFILLFITFIFRCIPLKTIKSIIGMSIYIYMKKRISCWKRI